MWGRDGALVGRVRRDTGDVGLPACITRGLDHHLLQEGFCEEDGLPGQARQRRRGLKPRVSRGSGSSACADDDIRAVRRERFPRTARHEALRAFTPVFAGCGEIMRCRPGTVAETAFAKVPDQRRTASRCAAPGTRGVQDYSDENCAGRSTPSFRGHRSEGARKP